MRELNEKATMQLPVQIQSDSGVPLYVQVAQQIRLLIHRGVLRPGELMPTVRELAVQLGINSNTVARVYQDLQREGVLVLRRGIGSFVADKPPSRPLAPADLRVLEKKVDELIALGRRIGLAPGELYQLIETRWEGNSHASRLS
jgi:GntR family transcriptional regulator